MENEESKSCILRRILARMLPDDGAKNLEAVNAIADGEPVQPMLSEFQVISDSAGNQFIPTPFTVSENNDNAFR